jgi:predicted MFS family arabinose efflux permease
LGASSLSLALAAFGGGFTIGRWGGERIRTREAALAGLVAAVVAIAASWLSYGIALGASLVVVIAVPLAGLGGKLGVSRRRR